MAERLVVWFEDVGMGDVREVGGKNASLGEMTRSLRTSGVRVPDGFATTAAAYRAFIDVNGIEPALRERIRQYRAGEASLRNTGEALRTLFLDSTFAEDIAGSIRENYRSLAERSRLENPPVAVRSSATAEDLPDASFAGQQETFLNVVGRRSCSMPVAAASRPCSPTEPSATGK